MLLLIQNADVYAPEPLGVKDVLVINGTIVSIEDRIEDYPKGTEIFDASGQKLMPGVIDQHLHIIGAGGKHGFHSMTPEITASELVNVGTTTVVGLLGTDGSTRSIKSLYAKVMALEQDGLSSWMYTGYYGLDPVHIMENVQDEMIFIHKVLGCKIAISDIRSSYPTALELSRLLRQVRTGGMIASKKGILHIHLGAMESKLDVLFEVVHNYHFPIEHISPTHVGRTKDLFDAAIIFAKEGGMIDITTGASKYTDPWKSIVYALDQGVDMGKMTFSSDGNAGLDKKDENGNVIGFRRAPIDQNLAQALALFKEGGLSFSEAIKPATVNPAINLGLKNKGRITVGADGDFCLIDDDLNLSAVVAKGVVKMKQGSLTFQDNFAR